MIGASTVETLVAVKNALDGAPVFMHLDLDVIDPEHFPAAVPAPGGLHPDKLYDLLDSVVEDCELVGLEVTAFEAPEPEQERIAASETAMHVLEPLLDHLAGDRQGVGSMSTRDPAADALAACRRPSLRSLVDDLHERREREARRRRGADRAPARAGQADGARAARRC